MPSWSDWRRSSPQSRGRCRSPPDSHTALPSRPPALTSVVTKQVSHERPFRTCIGVIVIVRNLANKLSSNNILENDATRILLVSTYWRYHSIKVISPCLLGLLGKNLIAAEFLSCSAWDQELRMGPWVWPDAAPHSPAAPPCPHPPQLHLELEALRASCWAWPSGSLPTSASSPRAPTRPHFNHVHKTITGTQGFFHNHHRGCRASPRHMILQAPDMTAAVSHRLCET